MMDDPGESAGPSNKIHVMNASSPGPADRRMPPRIPPAPPYPPLPYIVAQPPLPYIVVRAGSRTPSPAPSVDPEMDLWLSTADGRYSSAPVPIRVGQFPNVETFFVHRDVLIRSKWFEKALCGNFREAEEQVIDLPEEEPNIFHFVVSFLYERRFEPIQPITSALRSVPDKGKGKEEIRLAVDTSSDSSNSSSSSDIYSASSPDDVSFRELRRRTARRRTEGKTRGTHRSDCRCDRCAEVRNPSLRCNHCGGFPDGPSAPPPPPLSVWRTHGQGVVSDGERVDRPTRRIPPSEVPAWLMTYELNIDTYICAVRFLMDDFQAAVMRSTIDMLETAGTEAAHIQALRLCGRLHEGVPETDPLLSMVLARVGFLQALLWKKSPVETGEFLVANPELAAVMLRETSRRHETQDKFRNLPAMEVGHHERKRSSRV